MLVMFFCFRDVFVGQAAKKPQPSLKAPMDREGYLHWLERNGGLQAVQGQSDAFVFSFTAVEMWGVFLAEILAPSSLWMPLTSLQHAGSLLVFSASVSFQLLSLFLCCICSFSSVISPPCVHRAVAQVAASVCCFLDSGTKQGGRWASPDFAPALDQLIVNICHVPPEPAGF